MNQVLLVPRVMSTLRTYTMRTPHILVYPCPRSLPLAIYFWGHRGPVSVCGAAVVAAGTLELSLHG